MRVTVIVTMISLVACVAPPDPPPGEGEGEGEGDAAAALGIAPRECAFDAVSVGHQSVCNVLLSNTGNLEVAIEDVTINGDGTVFTVDPVPVGAVPPGTMVVVRIAASPQAPGRVEGSAVLLLAGDEAPSATIALSVEGVAAPSCIVHVTSVNDVPVGMGATPVVAPLDRVVLMLDATPGRLSGSIAELVWEIVGRPAGSVVQLTAPTAMSTGLSGVAHQGADVVGTYHVRGTAVDDLGGAGSCVYELVATPRPDGAWVQLAWDQPSADLDLHLRRAADPLCSAADCYALTCASTAPDWGGASASPRLQGEHVTVDAPVDGSYLVAVHGRAVTSTTTATVRAYSGGVPVFEGSTPVAHGEVWQALSLTCAGGSCAASADGALTTITDCAP